MFREFFASRSNFAAAWGGLMVILAYSMYMAHVKASINQFYAKFYDLLQTAGGILADHSSGEFGSGSLHAELAESRAEVWRELKSFAFIVAPLVAFGPVAKWARSAWALQWRMALMKSYLKHWRLEEPPIEGASQRLHEDSQRFASALQGCLVIVLDSVFTLVLFTPILCNLSATVAPPVAPFEWVRPVWLVLIANGAALCGIAGAALFGQRLVGLEVNNQKVEAALRRSLVIIEVSTPNDAHAASSSRHTAPEESAEPGLNAAQREVNTVLETCSSLFRNYHALFANFYLLNLYLGAFEQCVALLPYALVAPLLFASEASDRISLGTLIQVSNSFDKVFGSLNVIADSWAAINEFRSVVQRLREYETRLYRQALRRRVGSRHSRSHSLFSRFDACVDGPHDGDPHDGECSVELSEVEGHAGQRVRSLRV